MIQKRHSAGVVTMVILGLAAVLVLVAPLGCTTAENGAGPVQTDKQASADAKTDAKVEEKDDKEAEAEADDQRKLAKMERDLEIARQKLVKAQLATEQAEIQQRVVIAEAQRDLEQEDRRRRTFADRSAPNRLAWSELGLSRAEDRATESQEELQQLELMYAEEDFADQTKEIVLERGRRRLERSRRDLELRKVDHGILVEDTIPTETVDHELKVERKVEAVRKAERAAEASRMDKRIGIMSAEAEVARLEAEIEALKEKMAKRAEKKAAEAEGQE